MRERPFDKIFLGIVLTLSLAGLFIFSSTSMGLLTNGLEDFLSIFLKQLLVGLVFGLGGLFIFSRIYYKKFEKIALYLFILSVLLTLLVFIPGIGLDIKGAKRWIFVKFFSFQPSEILKLGFIIYFASYLAKIKNKVQTLKYGLVIPVGIVALPTIIILAQPDTGTLLSILAAWLSMFLVAGGRWKHMFVLIFAGLIVLGLVVYLKPYAMQRVLTFLDPNLDPMGAGYQIRQSLIAIGSGQSFGRGFGQSIQKFRFLPEPMGDSIFAVASEEFGFMGSSIIVILFTIFALRGLKIASGAPDLFGRLMATGIVILIVSQSFINIGAMLGLLPLTGIPLIFISHGGTALFMALCEIGIVLNISRYKV